MKMLGPALFATLAPALLASASPLQAQEWDPGPMTMYGGSVASEYESIERSRRMGVPVMRGSEAQRYLTAKRAREAKLRAQRRAEARAAARRGAASPYR